MHLIAVDYSGIGIFIAGSSLLIGILSWWLSKLLTDKKDITIIEVEIRHLKERVEDIEDELNDIRKRRT
jgi:hypothetical protein